MKMVCINGKFLLQQLTGVQRFATELLKKIEFYNPEICVLLPPNGTKKLSSFKPKNIIEIGFSNNFLIWEQVELPFYLFKKNNPLLLNFTGLGPIFYSNKIITIHDLSFWINPNWFSKSYSFYYKIFTPISAKNSKRIFTVSEFSKNEISRLLKINTRHINVLYNAPFNINKKSISREIRSNERPFFLTVSSLDPRKNLISLIKAFKELDLDIELKIVGSPNNRIFSKQNVGSSEVPSNIYFTGYLKDKDLINLYQTALGFIYPSLYEGFGLPPVEAMSYGCPVITSNRTSLPEVCNDAALYIDPLDIEDIKSSIIKIYKDEGLRNSLVKKGFYNIERFSWDKSAKTVLKLVKELNN
jgi:glycosyltransferase involved in cell wall biosynthesis